MRNGGLTNALVTSSLLESVSINKLKQRENKKKNPFLFNKHTMMSYVGLFVRKDLIELSNTRDMEGPYSLHRWKVAISYRMV